MCSLVTEPQYFSSYLSWLYCYIQLRCNNNQRSDFHLYVLRGVAKFKSRATNILRRSTKFGNITKRKQKKYFQLSILQLVVRTSYLLQHFLNFPNSIDVYLYMNIMYRYLLSPAHIINTYSCSMLPSYPLVPSSLA